ncbi:oligogalacturonate-specific porin KdgM family protein [Pectobacterium brasiliense]|uniref:oligogalacturonate-specific porin KdgM family protein n=1 Tax=Pectobacterium brasiliense TaxID=180957 RepID=UPI00404448E7
MKKRYLVAGILFAQIYAISASASDTKLSYEHSWGTMNRYHGDEIGMRHFMDNGLYVGVELNFYNKNKDLTIDDVVSNSYAFYTGYAYNLTPELTLTPNLEARFYSGGTSGEGTVGDIGSSQSSGARYTPGLKLTWSVTDKTDLHAQYRYDLRKITRSKRTSTDDDTHRHRYEAGVAYKGFDNFTLAYTAYYYHADYVLQNNKKHDYQQDFDVSYTINDNWSAHVGVEDVASGRDVKSREGKGKVGFTYTF